MLKDPVTRRQCLKGLAAGAALTWPLARPRAGLAQSRPAAESAARATATVLLKEPIRNAGGQPAVIEPTVHGHFVEHLGGVVYDGIWVGPDSKIPNTGGIRTALVESLRRIRPPVIRYPGGCFADVYHWRDGIGPRESRPRRFGRWGDVSETNQFGTHEFMHFCRLVGAEPYLAANVGTGTPQEFQEWVEYCNAPADDPRVGTTLGAERARREVELHGGKPDPFRVRYWGVGNESWDCGGRFTPEDYCTEYRRFSTWLPGYGVPLFPIAAGPNGNDVRWTQRFFKKWVDYARAPISAWAPHYYCGTAGTSTRFTVAQWYELLAKASFIETIVTDQWTALAEFDPGHAVRLAVDEWGCWHPADPSLPPSHTFAQVSTMRDALVAALTLDTFHRHADKVCMSNVAQLVNCLHSLYMTHEDQLIETTNYHVFDMYQPHKGGTATSVRIDAPSIPLEGRPALPRVAGSASVRDGVATLTLVHAHASEPIELVVKWQSGAAGEAQGVVLAHERLNAANTPASPREVTPRPLAVREQAEGVLLHLPPACVVRLQSSVSA